MARFAAYARMGAGFALLFLAGCASGPGNPFNPFSQTHKLTDSAKAMRNQVTEPVALPRELAKQPAPPYAVEPGDVLLVQPVDLDSPLRLPGDQPVLPDGTIQLGKYGRLAVAGRTVEDIESAVKTQIETQTKDAGPVTVRVVTRTSKVFYVLGEVNSPGSFTLSGHETVLDAILAAGGLTDRAAREDVTLSRPTAPNACRVVLPVCYNEIVQLGDTSTNYQIAAGDRVYVPSKGVWDDLRCHPKSCPVCSPQTACPLPAINGPADGDHPPPGPWPAALPAADAAAHPVGP